MVIRYGKERGYCGDCRHTNRGTHDFNGGLLACKFGLSVWPDRLCDIADDGKWLYERYDGKNCTWECQELEWAKDEDND